MTTMQAGRILFIFFTVLFAEIFLANEALAKNKGVTPNSTFQKNLSECFREEFAQSKLNTLNEIYLHLERKYLLTTSTLLEREVIFNSSSLSAVPQMKKLKYADDRWTLYKVLDNEVLESLNSGTRQKNQTSEMALSQLLIHAHIQSDWTKTKEIRAGERTVTLSRMNGQLIALQLQKSGQKNSLECKLQQAIDVCSCRESK